MNRFSQVSFLLAMAATWIAAQTPSATLSGVTVDVSDARVPKVQLTLSNSSTGYSRMLASGSEGEFSFPLLPPGTYKLAAELAGFSTTRIEPIVLQAGDQSAIQVRLRVRDTAESIDVQAELPLLREGMGTGTVVDRQFIENQPLNGRSFQSLVELAPGVTLTPTNVTSSGQFSVNGQRANANYFTIDGASANFGINGSATLYESSGGVLPAYSALGGISNLASVDAVQEFRVETSAYAPEYGRQPGGQIAIVTRSGTNTLHGAAFNYFRNDKLDANDWFANRNQLARPALRQNDFGFVIGGPVVFPPVGSKRLYSGKNRTFFFVSYEGLRMSQPAITSPILVPTQPARQLATGLAATILNAFPLPTGPASATDPNLAVHVSSFSNPSTMNATSFRVDQNVGNKVTLFGRFNYAPSQILQRAVFGTPNVVTTTDALSRTITLGANAIFSNNRVNEVRVNFSRAEQGARSALDSFGGAIAPALSDILPSFAGPDGSGSFTLGAQPSYLEFGPNAANTQSQFQIADTFSWNIGRHVLRFGFDWRRLSPEQFGSPYRQLVNFANVAQIQAGNINSATIIAANILRILPRYNNYSSFFQDTWRISSRLTLTYGLRWDINPAPTERRGEQPYTADRVEDLPNLTLARHSRLYDTRFNNVAPRAGIAYRPFASRTTVIRAGAGVFHDLGYAFTGSAYSTTVHPYGQIIGRGVGPFSSLNTPPPTFTVAPPYGRLFAYAPGFNVPYSVQYNFTVEQNVGVRSLVSVGYVGSVGRRLGRVTSLRSPSSLPSTFTRLDLVEDDGTSDFNSLQAQYVQRLSSGLQLLASYTLAKSIDLVSDETIVNLQAPALKADPRQDRGPSAFDIRHNFSLALSYQYGGAGSGWARAVSGGWGIDSIVRARSAAPVNIVTGTDTLGLGITSVSRPDVVAGQPLTIDDPAAPGGMRYNRAAFAIPAAGQQGNLGRNVLRGFSLTQWDLSLRRQFRIWERTSLQFRVDAFNLLNHPNFAPPIAALNNSNFGGSTQMLGRSLGSAGISGGFSPLYQVGGSRSMQLALRLQF